MLQLAGLLAIGMAFVAALVEPRIGLIGALLGYAFVPFAVGMIGLGPVSIHVSTAMLFAVLTAILLTQIGKHSAGPLLEGIPRLAIALLWIYGAGVILTELAFSTALSYSASFIINQLIGPVVLFILCRDMTRSDPMFYRTLAAGFVAVATVQSLLAILISRGIVPQPFAGALSERFWWSVISGANRMMGSTDHPLNLALLIAVAVPLLAFVERTWLRTGAFVLMLAGVVLTQSRLGVAAVAVGALYLVLRGSGSRRSKFSTIAVALAGLAVINAAGMLDSVLARLQDDSGSSLVRSSSWDLLLGVWDRFLIHGVGVADIKPMMTELFGMQTSPESAFLGTAMAYGIPLALMFFGALLLILISQVKRYRAVTPGVASMGLALVFIQFFSSTTVLVSSASVVVWMTVFFATAAPTPRTLAPQPTVTKLRGEFV